MAHTDDLASPARPGESAKSMLLTVLGELVLPTGGTAWTGTMVACLTALGHTDRNARQALARAGDDGLIEAERRGRKTRWHLTANGRRLLEAGADRIYRFGQRAEEWDGRWLVLHCTVPETMRPARRQLQTRLSFEGFGFLSPNVAISPHCDLGPTAEGVLTDLGLADRAVVIAGHTLDPSPDELVLGRAWDLDGLDEAYQAFLARFEAHEPPDREATLAALLLVVNHWRTFPFLDPELPTQLLPPDWAGRRARLLFDDRRARWRPPAEALYTELEAANDD